MKPGDWVDFFNEGSAAALSSKVELNDEDHLNRELSRYRFRTVLTIAEFELG